MGEENFGTMIIDGQLVNVDKLSVEELEKMQKNIKEKEILIRAEIEKELKILDDNNISDTNE